MNNAAILNQNECAILNLILTKYEIMAKWNKLPEFYTNGEISQIRAKLESGMCISEIEGWLND